MYFGDEGVLFKAGLPPLFGVAAVISFWLSNGTNKCHCVSQSLQFHYLLILQKQKSATSLFSPPCKQLLLFVKEIKLKALETCNPFINFRLDTSSHPQCELPVHSGVRFPQ